MRTYPIGIDDDDRTTNVGELLDITPEMEEIATRPYPMIVWHDNENGWTGVIPDLPGLSAAGETPEEMIAIIEEAKLLWIAAALAHGRAIPDPSPVPATITEMVVSQELFP